MADNDISIKRELQRWSIKGVNFLWFLFAITTSIMFLSVDVENTNPSQFDLVFSIVLVIFLLFGVVDQIRTKIGFRAVGIVLIGLYGGSLLTSNTEVKILIGGCFFTIFLVLLISLSQNIKFREIL